jgi:ATP-binding cassette subfamily B (MDR/TAP) protein 1
MKRQTLHYNEAGSIVTEVLSAVKTVVAYSGEEVEVKRLGYDQRVDTLILPPLRAFDSLIISNFLWHRRYEEKLKKGNKFELMVSLLSGAGSAVTWPMTYFAFALFYYFGVEFVIQDITSDTPVYTPAVILIVKLYLLYKKLSSTH